jgi:hypothetical protein
LNVLKKWHNIVETLRILLEMTKRHLDKTQM